MNTAQIFFDLPLEKRHFLLDSEYHPRVAAKKSSTPQIDDRQSAEPRKLPADWKIGDPF